MLLARPHPLIAERMRAWLEQHGFEPIVLTELAALAQAPGDRLRGAVVSAGVLSQVRVPPARVFRAIRDRWPHLAVALATIADLAAMERALDKTIATGTGAAVRRIETLPADDPGIGSPTLLILLHRDDLRDEARAWHASHVRERHFR